MSQLTVELTAVELHANSGLVVPVEGVEPDEPSNHRRKEGVSLCPVGFLVPKEHLAREGVTQRDRNNEDVG